MDTAFCFVANTCTEEARARGGIENVLMCSHSPTCPIICMPHWAGVMGGRGAGIFSLICSAQYEKQEALRVDVQCLILSKMHQTSQLP